MKDPIGTFLLFIVFSGIALFSYATAYVWMHQDELWLRECAKHRPLVECRADQAELLRSP